MESNLPQTDTAEDLIQQLYHQAQQGTSSRTKPLPESIDLIPPVIPDLRQSQFQLVESSLPQTGTAEDLIQQLYYQVQQWTSSRTKPLPESIDLIPPIIPDLRQSQFQLITQRHPLLRLNLTRASVANNCPKKQRGPLIRWWIVEHLQTEYAIMSAEDELLSPAICSGIGSRKSSIGGSSGHSSRNAIDQQVHQQQMAIKQTFGNDSSDKVTVDGEPPSTTDVAAEAVQNDSGVALPEDGGGSSDVESSCDDGAPNDAVFRDLSPLPDSPAMSNLADVLVCLEQMCLPHGSRPRRRDFRPAYHLNPAASTEHYAETEVQFEVRGGDVAVQLSCAFHMHAGDSRLSIPSDYDDDEAEDAAVLVEQSATTANSPLSMLKGVSKKQYGLMSGKFNKPPHAGDAYHAVKGCVHRQLLEAVKKNFGLLQPDEFMLRCWKKISRARLNQNILILDAPYAASSRNDMESHLRGSISALRYLVPLISKRGICEHNSDPWGDSVGMQPKIAVVCKTAADAERLSRTCARLMPGTRIALAIGLETSQHEDSRRERRNMLDGTQIIIASSLAFDRYTADWRAASDMLDDVRVIVVESAAAVLSTSCELLGRWRRLAVTGSNPFESVVPQLILVDSHGPAVGIINKFMCDVKAEQLRLIAEGSAENVAPINWLKVVAHPLDKLLFDNWQWEFVETAVMDDPGNNAAEGASTAPSGASRQQQLYACIRDIVHAHSRIPTQNDSSIALRRSTHEHTQRNDTVLMLACYYSDDRVEQFISALNVVGAEFGPGAVRYSKITSQMSDMEQRIAAMRWQTTSDCMWHVLLVQDSCSLKTLPTLPKLPLSSANAATAPYPSCEGAIFIDLAEIQADFMDRVLLLTSLPPPALASDDTDAMPNRRVLYQFFDYTMNRAMRSLVFMLNYGQHFAAGNAVSKLEHSFAVHAPLQELKRIGPVCRQFMLTGTCLLTDAMDQLQQQQQVSASADKIADGTVVVAQQRNSKNRLTGCLLRHVSLNVPFAKSESFLRQGRGFRFELLCLLSPVEIIGYFEDVDTIESVDELYEELCEQLEKHVQTALPVNASVCRENDLLIAEHEHCVFRCRLVRKNMPHSIVVEDYDCTLFRDMATGMSVGGGGGVVMRNGHVQLPLHSTRLFQLPRALDPSVTYNRSKQFKCFKVKMYLPSLLPVEPAGADLCWYPSVTKAANAFFQQHKNCQIRAKAEAFSDEWVAVDDVVARLTLFSVNETTTNSYRKFLIDNGMALENNNIKNGCASISIV